MVESVQWLISWGSSRISGLTSSRGGTGPRIMRPSGTFPKLMKGRFGNSSQSFPSPSPFLTPPEDIPALQWGRRRRRYRRRQQRWRRRQRWYQRWRRWHRGRRQQRQQQLPYWQEKPVRLAIHPAGEAPCPPREGPEEGEGLLSLTLLVSETTTRSLDLPLRPLGLKTAITKHSIVWQSWRPRDLATWLLCLCTLGSP